MDRYNKTDGTMQITRRLTPTAITALSGRMYSNMQEVEEVQEMEKVEVHFSCVYPQLCATRRSS